MKTGHNKAEALRKLVESARMTKATIESLTQSTKIIDSVANVLSPHVPDMPRFIGAFRLALFAYDRASKLIAASLEEIANVAEKELIRIKGPETPEDPEKN